MSDKWRESTLGEQVTLQRGYDITKQTMSDGPIPVISSGGINGYHNVAVAKGPGVLLGRKGSVGSVHYSAGDYWPHDTTLWVKDFHGNLPRFVYRFFNQFPIKRYEASTANPSLNRNNLHPVAVYWPPLAEQKRIAGILDAADALRTKRRESLAQLDSLLQSTFLTLFGDPVSNPMGWKEVEFEEIVESTKLGLVRGSAEFGWDMPVPYVRMDAITNDGRFLAEKVQGTTASEQEIEAYGLQSGDFLLNTRNSKELVGKVAVFRGPAGWTFNNNLIRIRFKANIEPDVISTQFRFARVQQALENRKAGTTSVFAIYWKALKTLPVLIPPLPLQRRFAAIVESVERQKARQRAHLAELDALFASLQHRAFRGEL